MDIVIFIYNIFLIILFAATITLSYTFYYKNKNKIYLVIMLMFVTNICDNAIIYMTELIDWFSKNYDAQFMTIPAFKTIILLTYSTCLLFISNFILKRSVSFEQCIMLIIMGLLLMFIPMLPNSSYKVWLYYLPCQIYLFVLSYSSLKYLNNCSEQYTSYGQKIFKTILKITTAFSILILIEDTIVIFNIDTYSDILVRIHNRNYSEDVLSIIYSFFAIQYFFKYLLQENEHIEDTILIEETNVETSELELHSEQKEINNDFLFEQFCADFDLTTREKEILEYVVQNKNNQDICELLHISIGTVKTHVHNIFVKLGVTKRSQVLKIYQQFMKQ